MQLIYIQKFNKNPTDVRPNCTSSDEFPSFLHQVRGDVIVIDVLMEAQEVQTAGTQAWDEDKHNEEHTAFDMFHVLHTQEE